jgi:chromosome segregation ATPase
MRLFEDIIDINDSTLKNKDHEKWLSSFAEKVKLWKSEVAVHKAKGEDETSHNEDTTDQLKAQVEHYKGVLGETERMLHQLQSTVETEESRWKNRLGEKEAELERVRKETEKLTENNIALQESLNVVNSAEEMEEKLQELQKKLADEESERKGMATAMSQMTEKQSSEKDNLVKEMGSLKNNLDKEKHCRSDLETKVAQMNHIISTAQEALQQEQKTVELLKQQISKTDKTTDSTSFISVNGNTDQNEPKKSQVTG